MDRWWDGEQWGPSLPDGRAASVENSRVAATAAHLGVLVAAVIVPLILYLAVDKRDRYARPPARPGVARRVVALPRVDPLREGP